MKDVDALIIGGGIAGLALTARLASGGARVLCVDKGGAAGGGDLRSTAFLQPAVATLEAAGAWALMADEAEPLWTMRILDCGGGRETPRLSADFHAREVMDQPFGWNVPNAHARTALLQRIDALDTAEVRAPVTATWVTREDAVLATLSDGQQVRAPLLIGADGRGSIVRERAGITARRVDYGQQAIVCAVDHEHDHEGVSTELHRPGGPFTLVPMRGRRSGIVWMNRNAEAAALMALSPEGFEQALNAESRGVLGRLTLNGARAAWPIGTLAARALTARRTALVAEAAHGLPPIGAQGLNMSLKDIEVLSALVLKAIEGGRDPGAPDVLSAYARARKPDIAARVAGIDALNRAVRSDIAPIREARALALGLVSRVTPVRRLAMRFGMGAG